MARLAQVVDPEALDACEGARAKLALNVERAWLRDGAILRVAVPKRLLCARCDGGGCDSCGRSGVLRSPDDEAVRSLKVQVPGGQPAGSGVVLRLTRPFPDHDAIAQLLIEVSPADEADPRVTRMVSTTAIVPTGQDGPKPWLVAALVALAGLLGWLAANGL